MKIALNSGGTGQLGGYWKGGVTSLAIPSIANASIAENLCI